MSAAGHGTESAVSPAATAGGLIPTICVLGNPNAGKSTIFNRLTGLSQKVGNYPGVTVEKKEGTLDLDGPGGERRRVRLVDLPGTYSLSANSPDEMIAVDVLLGRRTGGESPPALVLHIADASNLGRNLYLFSQLQELGVRAILVLNMMDVARKRGIQIDVDALSDRLGVPVVPTEGHRGNGLDALANVIRAELDAASVASSEKRPAHHPELPPPLRAAVDEVCEATRELSQTNLKRDLHPYEILRALVDAGGYAEESLARRLGDRLHAALASARAKIPPDSPAAALEADARYRWVRERLQGCVQQATASRRNWSETIDRVLTHRILGLLVFGAMMFVVFEAIFSWAQPLMESVDAAFGLLGGAVSAALPQGALTSLLVDGVIAGVGAVVVFLPQILILFLFIGILEDCGYMARAAFLMDKVMSKCGLSGKSFIPMLSGFACAIPGIMATRVIEDRRDRIATILVTPLMTCSARLPVYAILIETFIPGESLLGGWLGLQAVTLLGLYVLGIVTAIVMAWLFKKTLLRGGTSPFILELPAYKWPSLRMVIYRLYDRAKAFLTRAGTIILAITVVVWALAYFPHPNSIANDAERQRRVVQQQIDATPANDADAREALQERLAQITQEEAGDYLNQSFFGRMGKTVEPVFRPLGWDWRISMAAIMSFPAREVIVSTLGTIYNLGTDTSEESTGLREKLRASRWPGTNKPVYTIPVALSIMVFFALCCQCGATVATIKRETNSWGWAWFTFGYMTVLAYAGALATYQVGTALASA